MGCTTVGLLLVVRTEARREEFATCLALGATRTRLARGIILEGAMLTLAAAALSPLVAWWLFSAVSAFQLPGGIALGLLDLSLDRRSVAVILTSSRRRDARHRRDCGSIRIFVLTSPTPFVRAPASRRGSDGAAHVRSCWPRRSPLRSR
jgi:ABC-type antimicrobial peptide transport system permease subunit